MHRPLPVVALVVLFMPVWAFLLDKVTAAFPVDLYTVGIVGGAIGAFLLAAAVKRSIWKRIGWFVGGLIVVALQLYGLAMTQLAISY